MLYKYVDLPTGVSATVNNDAGVTGTHRGHVWSEWAPRDNYRVTVRVGAPSGTTQGVQVDLVEFRSYATGAIPYFPTLRFPGQYADAETEKYINWNRFYDPSTGRYLQPEPLLHDSEFARAMVWGVLIVRIVSSFCVGCLCDGTLLMLFCRSSLFRGARA